MKKMDTIHYEPLWYAARTGKNINLCQVIDSMNWKKSPLYLIKSKNRKADYVEGTYLQ
jgi:hypothetical protein